MSEGTEVSDEKQSELTSLLSGDFRPSEADIRLWNLAKRYHDECEAFDQKVCTKRDRRGVTMPATAHEFRAVNRNALDVREQILRENPDIGRSDLQTAINWYAYKALSR